LSLTLDRAYGGALDEVLLKPMPPALQGLVGSIDAALLLRVLERALDEGNIPVILAATQALGERGDVRAARTTAAGLPHGIVRALYFPDRRVQFTAARALLGIPGQHVPVAASRVVDIFRRFVAASPQPKALMAYAPAERHAEYRKNLKLAGFEPVLAKNLKDAFAQLKATGDFDVVLLHEAADKELAFALAQIRGDADLGRTPILIVAGADSRGPLERLAARYADVRVVPEGLLLMADELKSTIESATVAAAGAPLSAAERKDFARVSLGALWRMARNEIPGYDVRPALDVVLIALRNPDTAPEALEILSRLPGVEPQGRLAATATDAGQGKLRIPAAIELNRHIQKHGLLLSRQQINQVKQAYQQAPEPQLKAQLALVMGALGPSAQLTGSRLVDFRPDVPAPMVPGPAEKKEKEKKDKE
jgi:hypothetical protein